MNRAVSVSERVSRSAANRFQPVVPLRDTRSLTLAALLLLVALAVSAAAAERGEFRAVWVDGFNAGIRTPEEADKLVAEAKAANLNALIVQVRRRGDSFYSKSLEPPVEDPPYSPEFDALAYLLEKAHAAGLEVHAWMNAMPLWRKSAAPPRDPRHVFNTHGPNAAGRDNWLTRSPQGDTIFPVGYFLDPGHPDAAGHIAGVVRNLVQNYKVDGIHLDYIRYPETEKGMTVGYNEVSLERFRKRYGITAADPPANDDPRWCDWRREQVTNLVRRIYLEASEINPPCKVSAAVITWGDGPAGPKDWPRSNAYSRIYQDWQAWLKEGILDLAVPMNYFRQSDARTRSFYQHWLAFESRNKQGRQLAVGLGAYLNSPEDNLTQLHMALDPLRSNKKRAVDGISFFSYNGRAKIMPQLPAIFPAPAPVPAMKWKEKPTRGHLCGLLAGADGARVEIQRKRWWGWSSHTVRTDGNGFFGAVHLPPGNYRLKLPGRPTPSGPLRVQAGRVTRVPIP
jgi:uncharacterized lipoprotein YddW (UPF0748 family)